ncbi:DNA-binding protein jumonji/RBP2/SMCY, contains JmjC domain [Ceraceosorus bombacis]|uniref:[histone H3]-trimethyl-L-lysine(4) demethylase n=1 Tax=Ceraceosorus bombacis TaxID=401625 RepID=A0A0P1BJ15_9BASI|nr:DNA-binding protein jumonji/RBP2/SMCY, contains JmjC domain [Ceraceosorus bombacis]
MTGAQDTGQAAADNAAPMSGNSPKAPTSAQANAQGGEAAQKHEKHYSIAEVSKAVGAQSSTPSAMKGPRSVSSSSDRPQVLSSSTSPPTKIASADAQSARQVAPRTPQSASSSAGTSREVQAGPSTRLLASEPSPATPAIASASARPASFYSSTSYGEPLAPPASIKTSASAHLDGVEDAASEDAPNKQIDEEPDSTSRQGQTFDDVDQGNASSASTPTSYRIQKAAAAAIDAAAAKLARIEPTFITSRDFAPQLNGDRTEDSDPHYQAPKEGGMKRRNKDDELPNGKDGSSDASAFSTAHVKGDPAMHPTRKAALRIVQQGTLPPLPFNNAKVEDGQSEPYTGTSTIPTRFSTPRHPPPRQRERLFELEEAPTFYPTWQDFADPMRYIEWVASSDGGRGKEYGIVKIVPPQGWNPEFALDQELFSFRTRVQRLNSLSADARASLNYQEQLQKFHAQQGHARVSIPIVDRRPVDLYSLKLIVAELGGPETVVRNRKWSDVTRKLGYADSDANHLAAQVKAAYYKIIHPFEKFLLSAKEQVRQASNNTSPAGVPGTASAVAALNMRSTPMPTSQQNQTDFPSVQSAHPTDGQSTLTWAELTPAERELWAIEDADAASSSKRRSTRRRTDYTAVAGLKGSTNGKSTRRKKSTGAGGMSRAEHQAAEEDLILLPGAEEQMCEICLRGDDGMEMLLCDECNRGYHMYCLDPPLTSVPKSQWFCPPCLVGTGNDFGFDDGETHTLHSFWKRADAFRSDWWAKRSGAIWKPAAEPEREGSVTDMFVEDVDAAKPGPLSNGLTRPIAGTNLRVAEDDVEREFWRLIEDPNETVEVEYGADIHSTAHGSALPTLETCPLSSYARDGWNLNNLPILSGSLLRYIKSDISGMTVPWIYVGMMFSTFCWHNEDHYTYSINYQHWGDTKTWYGIPGVDAQKFEEAMRRAAPDLFETSPDLLFQLVTMMSPAKLKREGVRVYACDQRANELVITFPKAYHSGFNQGFNLNEAVNFALPDWLDRDLECVQRYQRFSKQPVFSHDELVVTIYQHSQVTETAMWLHSAFAEVVNREISGRKALRDRLVMLEEEVYDKDRPEKDTQCTHCKCFCYLAQVTTEGTTSIACLDHVEEVHGSDVTEKRLLRMRFSDDNLESMLVKVSERAEAPRQWEKRFKKLLRSHARPPLKSLRNILAEGERLPFAVRQVEELRDFIEQAQEWVDSATAIITRKGKRQSTMTASIGGPPSLTTRRASRAIVKASASPDHRSLGEGKEDASRDTDGPPSPKAVYTLLEESIALPFDAPEISQLRDLVSQIAHMRGDAAELIKREMDAPDDSEEPPMDAIQAMLDEGESINVALPELQELSRIKLVRQWFKEMDEIHANFINLDEVEELLAEAAEGRIPETQAYHADLLRRRELGREWKAFALHVLDGTELIRQRDLEHLTTTSNEVAVVPELHQRAEALLKKAREYQKLVETVFEGMAEPRPGHAVPIGNLDQLPEARRIVKLIKAARLHIGGARVLAEGIDLYDEWNERLQDLLETTFAQKRAMSPESTSAQLDQFFKQIRESTELDDEVPPESGFAATQRQCVCRTTEDINGPDTVQCEECMSKYHLECLKMEAKEIPKHKSWFCPVCQPQKLPKLLAQRRAISLRDVTALACDARYEPHCFQFPPKDLLAFGEAEQRATRLHRIAYDFLVPKPAPTYRPNELMFRHILRKAIGCPVDPPAPNGAPTVAIISQVLFNLHGLDGQGNPVPGIIPRPNISVLKTGRYAGSPTSRPALPVYGARTMPSNQSTSASPSAARPNSGVTTSHATPHAVHTSREPTNAPNASGSTAKDAQRPPSLGQSAAAAHEHPPSFDEDMPASFSGLDDVPAPLAGDDDDPAPVPGEEAKSAEPEYIDPRKRKRGKRAKLIFAEEVGSYVPINGERVYCICKKAESGAMISCDRCMAWYHCNCVFVDDSADLPEGKWLCPLCCVKTERKYPHAEVKVRESGVTDPNLFLDVRATLRSQKRPISKFQVWSTVSESRRLVLHLESWYPAVAVDHQAEPAAKKARRTFVRAPGPASASTAELWAAHGSPGHAEAQLPETHTPLQYPPPSHRGNEARLSGAPSELGFGAAHHHAGGNAVPMHPQRGYEHGSMLDRQPDMHPTPMPLPIPGDSRSAHLVADPALREAQMRAEREAQAQREAKERHRAGMANLYSRGVTDAMIEKWYVGWSGKNLVYPRYDEFGNLTEMDLGTHIVLAPDDQDGTKFMERLLENERAMPYEPSPRSSLRALPPPPPRRDPTRSPSQAPSLPRTLHGVISQAPPLPSSAQSLMQGSNQIGATPENYGSPALPPLSTGDLSGDPRAGRSSLPPPLLPPTSNQEPQH